MAEKVDRPDLVVAGIAGRQHGVVSMRQLRSIGLSDQAVALRVRSGRLHRVHRGVYTVGYRGRSRETRWMAAVLACGKRAVLSHASAAALWGLLPAPAGPIDVATPARSGRSRRAGIRLHRCPSLGEGTMTTRRGIPVTTPARTIADLRRAVPGWQWRRAVRQAELAGYRLGPDIEVDGTRSDLERDFLRLCRRYGLPAPEVNVKVGQLTVDFLWRRERLVVETDSYRYHRGEIAFQDDRARDLDLRRQGFDVRRFSERQLNQEPKLVASDLRGALCGVDSKG